MKKILVDTNIILDLALERMVFHKDSKIIFELIDEDLFIGYITATTVTDIYYIIKKAKGHSEAISFIKNLIDILQIVRVEKETILRAIELDLKDFEDGIQVSSAELNDIEIIITRNKSDFIKSSLQILAPNEFIDYLKHC